MNNLTVAQKWILAVTLIVGASLRFYNFSDWSLSNDELSALNRLRFTTFHEVIEQGVKLNDMHPPGVQSFLYTLTKMAGNDVGVVRLPFVIMGIFSILAFFLVADRWIRREGSLAATALFSGLIFPILYSQLARPYSPGILFSLLTVYFLTRIVYTNSSDKNETINYGALVGFILCGSISMYIHYFSFLFIGIAGITFLFLAKPKIRIALLISGLVMMALYIPAIPVLTYQMSIGGLGGSEGWLGPPEKDAFLKLIFFIFNESYILIALVFVSWIISILLSSKIKTRNTFRPIALLFFLLPFLIAFFYSIFRNPVYQHSIMIFSFPFLLIYIFSYTPMLKEKTLTILCTFILCITALSTIAEKRFYHTIYFGVFKDIAEDAVESGKKYGTSNITYATNVLMPYYIDYYQEKLQADIKYKLYSCNTAEGLEKLNTIASTSTTELFSYSWSNTADPFETDQIISRYFPYKVKQVNYFNSGYRLYSRDSTKGNAAQYKFTYLNDYESVQTSGDSVMLTAEKSHSGNHSVLYNPENEFGPGFKKNISETAIQERDIVWIQLWVYVADTTVDGNLVFQIDADNKSVLWRGASLKSYIKKVNQWTLVYLACQIPEATPSQSTISAYFWNSGKKKIYTDDFSLRVLR
ncbi:MAG: glycosyltransferase family 39 protein [Bacteroidota bacterium]